ncbi:MAG: PQQ-dependent sugar dehydrogenase [Phycisphaerales bacterium JB040]
MPRRPSTVLAASALAVSSSLASAQLDLSTETVATGLSSPTFVTHAPGDAGRLYVLEKAGRIRLVDLASGQVQGASYLDIASSTSTVSEQGLLGLAFHPQFEQNGLFYIYHTELSGTSVLAEYAADGDPLTATRADASSRRELLRIGQPQANHNGGWLGFGPDGYLYIASGDGGGSGDTGAGHNPDVGNGQSLETLLGKMLRIDVDGDDFPADNARNYAVPSSNPFVGVSGLDEIWAYGLRNPWRNSFDRQTGDLYIADVGQNAREEVNFQGASSVGGENYGWRCREGTFDFNTGNCPDPSTLTEPVHDYTHVGKVCASITGGYVYRGCAAPELDGWYLFGDYCTGQVWALKTDGVSRTDFQNLTNQIGPGGFELTSFGEDLAGEMYMALYGSGELRRIVSANPVDDNNNGVADSCETVCTPDINADGVLDNGDLNAFVTLFLDSDLAADFTGDGILDNGDIGAFVTAYLAGC